MKPPLGPLTRRELLRRMAGAGAGAATLGLLPGCSDPAELWERQPVIRTDAVHKGVCRFCGTGCGVTIGTRDGMIVDVQGDDLAHNRGRLCIKGLMNREILYVRDRALHPLVRDGDGFRQATWDEAMTLVAERFGEAIARHGPDSVAFYGSGQLSTQESYTANKLFKAGIGTNNIDGNPRLCMTSAAAAYTSVFGKDEPMGCYDDIEHATMFFVTGANMAACHPVLWERVLDRKRSRPETPIVAVDPRRTATTARADLHLAILPGTDVTLLNAMLRELLHEGHLDEDVIRNHLRFQRGAEDATLDELEEHLEPYTPEAAASVCRIAADDIREAAHLFGSASAAMSLWTMGLNQQYQGTASNRLVMAMHLLTGQIGRPGATPFSLTGQPNAGGGVRDTGMLSHALPAGRAVANEADRREMERIWGVPEGRIAATPGLPAVAMFEAMAQGDVRCCLVMGTNPAQSLPNVDRYREGMERAFLVVADAFHPTETTRYADVILPAAMWAEKDGMYSQSERRYHHTPKVVEPLGEARSDLEILVDLADRLGHDDLIPARDPVSIWDEWREITRGTAYDFSGMTYERLRDTRGILWPCPSENHPGTCRRFVPGEDPLATGDGRLDFYGRPDRRAIVFLHDQEPPQDPTDDDFPLVLNTGRVLEHWHTMTMTGRVPQLEPLEPHFLQVHPRDARALGVADGDAVRVESRRGGASFVAAVTEAVRPGVVFATFHSARRLVNRAVSDVVDPISREPDFKNSAVRVEREATA